MVAAFIGQGGVDRGRGFVDEAVGVQGREDRLPLLGRQARGGLGRGEGSFAGPYPR